jgi:hypothetical protein
VVGPRDVADPGLGYIATYRMRGEGFRVDVSASVRGDVEIRAQVDPTGSTSSTRSSRS